MNTVRQLLVERVLDHYERFRAVERRRRPPEKEPAQAPSIPGRTYENPNEDETYTAPPDEDDGDEDDRR